MRSCELACILLFSKKAGEVCEFCLFKASGGPVITFDILAHKLWRLSDSDPKRYSLV